MRRHSVAVLAVAAAIGLAGCGAQADPAVPVADADLPGDCGAVEHPPLQVAMHLVGDADPPADYSSVPPSSGWHRMPPPAPGQVLGDMDDPDLVAALESGTVVLAMDPEVAADDTSTELAATLVEQFPERLLATTYVGMPTPVALVTWGRIARCESVDAAAVTAFVLTQRVAAEH